MTRDDDGTMSNPSVRMLIKTHITMTGEPLPSEPTIGSFKWATSSCMDEMRLTPCIKGVFSSFFSLLRYSIALNGEKRNVYLTRGKSTYCYIIYTEHILINKMLILELLLSFQNLAVLRIDIYLSE